ncbi:MAG: thioredoxin fold domain-containing protein, partial [Nitrospirota bacterium]
EINEGTPCHLESATPEQILEAIQRAGIVGLGGAAFPTHVKLKVPEGKRVDTLVVNGVECEPYLTTDHRVMLEQQADIVMGIRYLLRATGAERAIIGIEANKLDVAAIPLEGALLLGSPDAPHKAVIFSDPDCPYCRKLHQEMKKVVQEREDIAFYIKLRPLDSHPESYQKSKSIVCEGSLRLLERAYDGRSIPAPACKSTVVDETIALADKLGITGTPTIVLPDGGVVSGYRDAPQLEALIDGAVLALKQKEEEAKRAEEEAERKAAEEARRARERPAQTPQQPAATSEMKSPSGAASEGEVSTAPGAPLTEERVTSEEMKPPEAGATAPAEAAEKPKPERKRRWHWPWE